MKEAKKAGGEYLSASRGNRIGIGIFRILLRCGGEPCAFWLARFVTWFYARFDRRAFAATKRYLELRFPEDAGRPAALRRHFHRLLYELAKMLIVSHEMGNGAAIPIEIEGAEHLPPEGGLVVVMAHFGCWQGSMDFMNHQSGRRIHIMARPDRNGNMDKYLALRDRHGFNIISTDGFSGGLLEASAALSRGEAVIVMGDRAVDGSAKSPPLPYFGGSIELPLSPWMLAARNGVPALPVFTEFEENPRRVVIRLHPPIRFADTAARRVRAEDLSPALAGYAALLEGAARRSPYSVFRFGDEEAAAGEDSSNPISKEEQ